MSEGVVPGESLRVRRYTADLVEQTTNTSYTNVSNNPWATDAKEGWLEVFVEEASGLLQSTKWKKRWIVLARDQLIVLDKPSKKVNVNTNSNNTPDTHQQEKKPLAVYSLRGCQIKKYSSRKKAFSFQIFHNEMDVVLGASSQAEMEEWMAAIRERIGADVSLEKLQNTGCEINPNDLEWSSEVIGKGGSGLVKRGTWLKSVPVAIKTLNNIPEFIEQEEYESFLKEIALLSEMRHPNVVSMFGFCRKDGYICLVTEYITGGDLSTCLKDKSMPLPASLKLEIAMNISAALIYLHGRNIIHR